MSDAAIQNLEKKISMDDCDVFDQLRKAGYTLVAHDGKHFEWLLPDEGGGTGVMDETDTVEHARKLYAALRKQRGEVEEEPDDDDTGSEEELLAEAAEVADAPVDPKWIAQLEDYALDFLTSNEVEPLLTRIGKADLLGQSTRKLKNELNILADAEANRLGIDKFDFQEAIEKLQVAAGGKPEPAEESATTDISPGSDEPISAPDETSEATPLTLRTDVHPDELRRDGGTQPRAELSQAVVEEYAEAMLRGDKFPPVVAFWDGVELWLASGFHRQAAAIKAGKLLDVEVREGTVRDAILFSVGENATHGLRRSNADKHRAVETLLNDREWAQWSDGVIALKAGVSQTFVSKLRRESDSAQIDSTARKGRDGRVIETANIGATASRETVKETFLGEKAAFDIEQAMEDLPGPEVTEPTEEELSDGYTSDYECIEVEAARLKDGGDIEESYSADLIADHKGKSRVRTPFRHDGKLYVATSGGPGLEAEAYQLVPASDFEGETVGYNDDHEKARRNPLGFYHGMRVTWKKKPYVLQGPELHFIAAVELKDEPVADISSSFERPKQAIPPQNTTNNSISYTLPELLDLAEEYQKGGQRIAVSGFLVWLKKREKKLAKAA